MIRRLSQSRFVRNVAVLSSGQAIAQGLAIAASPILTRLYAPDAFGSLGLLVSLSGTLIAVSGLRYEMAVVTARDDTTAVNLLTLSCFIVFLTSALSAGFVASAGHWLAALVDQPDFGPVLWWLPVLILVGGLFQAFSYWATRRKHFRSLAVRTVVQSLATLVSQISAGLARLGSLGLIGGRALGTFVGASILAAEFWRYDKAIAKSGIKASIMIQAAKDNSQFPKYNAPQNLINSLSKTLIPYTLAPFFGLELVGFYFLAERVLRTPSLLVTGSMRQVYYQRASELYNQGKSFYRLYVSTTVALAAISFIPLTVLIAYGPEIFSFVFGAEWRKAGTLTQWLGAWWLISVAAGPAVESLTVLQLQKYMFWFQIAFSTTRVLSILIGAMFGDDIVAIAAFSMVGLVFNLGLIFGVLLLLVRQRSPVQEQHGAV